MTPAPGRPASPHPKPRVTLGRDGVVLHRLRSGGPGWRTWVDAILREALGV